MCLWNIHGYVGKTEMPTVLLWFTVSVRWPSLTIITGCTRAGGGGGWFATRGEGQTHQGTFGGVCG